MCYLLAGFGQSFDLGRNVGIAEPDPWCDGKLTLNLDVLCAGMSDTERQAFVQEHFLTPKRVEWPDNIKRQVVGVGLGESHLLVAVREEDGLNTKVYACGQNDYGQLGLGHMENCTTLTHVRRWTSFLCVLAPFRIAAMTF